METPTQVPGQVHFRDSGRREGIAREAWLHAAKPTMKPIMYAAIPTRETTTTASRGSNRNIGMFAVRILSASIGEWVPAGI